MFFPKFASFVVLALSTSVGALIAPKTKVGTKHVGVRTADGSNLAKQNGFDHALGMGRGGAKDDNSKALFGIDNRRNDLIAPAIYTVFTGVLVYIFYQLRDAIVAKTIGSAALSLVTIALVYDNLIVAIGSLFFRDAERNDTKHSILKMLSYPRFTLHAVGVPLQCVTIAEMGKFAGIGVLQSDFVQWAIAAAAILVAILDRKRFLESPGISLDTMTDSPVEALERDLVKFTYKEFNIAYLIPVVVLAVFNLVVGILARKTNEGQVGNWMIFAACSALVGNGVPGPIMAFAGNLGEIGMQFGLLRAARIVFAGN